MPIPTSFNCNGMLDIGTYDASIQDIKNSILVLGDGSSETWDNTWRNQLVNQASILIHQLWSAGVEDIFLDGSFVEDKDHPNDIDGYFDPHFNQGSGIKDAFGNNLKFPSAFRQSRNGFKQKGIIRVIK